jgi:hypothetical protein
MPACWLARQTVTPDFSGRHNGRSLPAFRLEGFAAVAAFAFAGLFLTAAEQWLGDDGFGLVWPLFGFAHGVLAEVVVCSSGIFCQLSAAVQLT